jgi:metal-responsive CopG/Arc/MetJ family transcriptional regulator
MRTIVDLPKDLIDQLDQRAAGEQLSRAEVVRRLLIKAVAAQDTKKDWSRFVGLWEDRALDGVAFQRALRDAED